MILQRAGVSRPPPCLCGNRWIRHSAQILVLGSSGLTFPNVAIVVALWAVSSPFCAFTLKMFKHSSPLWYIRNKLVESQVGSGYPAVLSTSRHQYASHLLPSVVSCPWRSLKFAWPDPGAAWSTWTRWKQVAGLGDL